MGVPSGLLGKRHFTKCPCQSLFPTSSVHFVSENSSERHWHTHVTQLARDTPFCLDILLHLGRSKTPRELFRDSSKILPFLSSDVFRAKRSSAFAFTPSVLDCSKFLCCKTLLEVFRASSRALLGISSQGRPQSDARTSPKRCQNITIMPSERFPERC